MIGGCSISDPVINVRPCDEQRSLGNAERLFLVPLLVSFPTPHFHQYTLESLTLSLTDMLGYAQRNTSTGRFASNPAGA